MAETRLHTHTAVARLPMASSKRSCYYYEAHTHSTRTERQKMNTN